MGGDKIQKTPPWDDVIEHSEATKAYWAQWDLFELSRGCLVPEVDSGRRAHSVLQLIPPQGLRTEVMRNHTGFTGGHLGTRKTQNQVRRRACWRGWREDVRRFC